jgi:hypothetical protein
MSLSARDRHALESIGTALASSDPKLASMLGAFTRLTAGEDMPGPEMTGRCSARAVRILLRLLQLRRRRTHRRPLQRAWPGLLWLAISLAMITLAVVVDQHSPVSCGRAPASACAGHAVGQAVQHPAGRDGPGIPARAHTSRLTGLYRAYRSLV